MICAKNSIYFDCIAIFLTIAYLSINIENVGSNGEALLLLVAFFLIAFFKNWSGLIHSEIVFSKILFVFFVFAGWLIFRVLINLHDIEYLKQITIATTSGIILFFLFGVFLRQNIDNILFENHIKYFKIFILFSLFGLFVIYLRFVDRLLERTDIFYIANANEGYQRAGNFMIIIFILLSLFFLCLSLKLEVRKKTIFFVWFGFYFTAMVFLLISSQMIGSNAATANVLAIYLITITISLLVFDKKLRELFYRKKLGNFKIHLMIFKKTLLIVFFGLLFSCLLIWIINFDFNRLRVFGFGSDEASSFSTRMEILIKTGIDQIGFDPIFGNANVAYLTTGDSGRALHSFSLNILAEFGIFGLLGFYLILFYFLKKLIKSIKYVEYNEQGLLQIFCSYWFIFVFCFLFLYANFAVGKEWAVIWFFLGLAGGGIKIKK